MIFQKSRKGSPSRCNAKETVEGPTNRGHPAGKTGSRSLDICRSLGESTKVPQDMGGGGSGQPQWGLQGWVTPEDVWAAQLWKRKPQSPCGLAKSVPFAKQVHMHQPLTSCPRAGEALSENRLRGSGGVWQTGWNPKAPQNSFLSPQLSPADAGRCNGDVQHRLQEEASFLLGPAVP